MWPNVNPVNAMINGHEVCLYEECFEDAWTSLTALFLTDRGEEHRGVLAGLAFRCHAAAETRHSTAESAWWLMPASWKNTSPPWCCDSEPKVQFGVMGKDIDRRRTYHGGLCVRLASLGARPCVV